MIEIESDQLAHVIGGGESSSSVRFGMLEVKQTKTDYRVCVDAMRDAARREFSRRSQRAHAEAEYIGRYCGLPDSRPK